MPRPPKYTDYDIAEAIDSLIGVGKEINPSRVKHLLGGGNIERIKAVIDRRAAVLRDAEADTPDLPPSMMAELRRHNDRSFEEIQQLATKLWQSARDEASKGKQHESASLLSHISELEEDLSIAKESKRQIEQSISEERLEKQEISKHKNELVEQCEQLKAALRNAESDLRASERTISILDRAQRLDREEIRLLQKRIEEIVAELATIKTKHLRCQLVRNRGFRRIGSAS